MATAQSKPSSHVNSPQVGSARLAQQGPLTLPDDKESLNLLAPTHSAPIFPRTNEKNLSPSAKILGICVRDACQ